MTCLWALITPFLFKSMLTKQQKSKIVEDLTEKFKRQKIAIFSDFTGVSVSKFQILRRILKKDQAEYKVTKKTLFDRALQETGVNLKTKELRGEIGATFGYGEETAPAKILLKFSRQNETFKILGGILGNRILSAKEVITFAKLPPREIIMGQLLNVMQSPIRGLATVLEGNIKNLAVVLNKIQSSKSK